MIGWIIFIIVLIIVGIGGYYLFRLAQEQINSFVPSSPFDNFPNPLSLDRELVESDLDLENGPEEF